MLLFYSPGDKHGSRAKGLPAPSQHASFYIAVTIHKGDTTILKDQKHGLAVLMVMKPCETSKCAVRERCR